MSENPEQAPKRAPSNKNQPKPAGDQPKQKSARSLRGEAIRAQKRNQMDASRIAGKS